MMWLVNLSESEIGGTIWTATLEATECQHLLVIRSNNVEFPR